MATRKVERVYEKAMVSCGIASWRGRSLCVAFTELRTFLSSSGALLLRCGGLIL